MTWSNVKMMVYCEKTRAAGDSQLVGVTDISIASIGHGEKDPIADNSTAAGRQANRRVTITLYHSRLFDKDNSYGACKVIFDALKAQGLIVDDSPEWLDAIVEQKKCKHKERHTVIQLEAI